MPATFFFTFKIPQISNYHRNSTSTSTTSNCVEHTHLSHSSHAEAGSTELHSKLQQLKIHHNSRIIFFLRFVPEASFQIRLYRIHSYTSSVYTICIHKSLSQQVCHPNIQDFSSCNKQSLSSLQEGKQRTIKLLLLKKTGHTGYPKLRHELEC